MAFKGVNFRASSGYVSDGTDHTYSLGETYPTTRGGLTFGWASSAASDSRDRSSGIDTRLAGIIFQANSGGATKTFTLDLPNGAGTYNVRLAVGDAAGSQNNKVIVKDGGTDVITVNRSTTSNFFTDAASGGGVDGYSPAAWPGSNTYSTITFTNSSLTVVIGGHASGTSSSVIAHISVEFVSGGGGSTLPVKFAQLLRL